MSRPRNFLVLVTDDQRFDALGCAGNSVIRTPHLDAVARAGTLFPNAFTTTPICPSSRASIFTGVHTRCHGVVDFAKALPKVLLDHSYPALLRAAGYWTGFVGKYGVGKDLPENAFDDFQGFGGQGDYFPRGEAEGPHLTQILAQQAVDFLERRPKDRPFCLSVSFKAPHGQKGDPRKFVHDHAYDSLYADVDVPPPDKSRDEDFARLPDFFHDVAGHRGWAAAFAEPAQYQEMVRRYYRLINGVDDAVAKIRVALDRLGLADDTVLVFTSDHGFFLGERQLVGKWLLFEEAIRVPLIVLDPTLDPRHRAPRAEAPVLNVDVAPTLLSMAGVDVPSFVTGRDFSPFLVGAQPDWRNESFFEHHFDPKGMHPKSEGLRLDVLAAGTHKYIRYVGIDPPVEELYDLRADPREVENLAGTERGAAVLEHCRERWSAWTEGLAAWRPEPSFRWRDPAR